MNWHERRPHEEINGRTKAYLTYLEEQNSKYQRRYKKFNV